MSIISFSQVNDKMLLLQASICSTYIAYSFSIDEDIPRHQGSHPVKYQRQIEKIPAIHRRMLFRHHSVRNQMSSSSTLIDIWLTSRLIPRISRSRNCSQKYISDSTDNILKKFQYLLYFLATNLQQEIKLLNEETLFDDFY